MAQRARDAGPRSRSRSADRSSSRAGYGGRPATGAGRSRDGGRAFEDAGPPPLSRAELAALRNRLRELVAPVVQAEGLDLEDVVVTRAGRRYVVRITVDADGGIGHDELSDASRAISAALDAAEAAGGELTPGAYTLELSSPGIDRPLTLPRHWQRNVGRLVSVRVEGTGQVTGRVVEVGPDGVVLEVNGQRVSGSFAQLGPGRVQVEFNRLAELSDEELGPEISDDEYDDGLLDESDGDQIDQEEEGDQA
jgi:ribosome maturation factor RimP